MAFTQGISGLRAAAADLDNIGNNIANSQTTGYKSSRTQFADIYANARTGLGVSVAGTQQDFSVGSLNGTGRNLDVAIDGGGFFRMADGNQTVYSRDGGFQQTKDGQLANSSGALLTGYNVSNFNNPNIAASVKAGGDPQVIQIPQEGLNAKATTQASFSAALDSGADSKAGIPFDPDDASTYNWSAPASVYDSLGNAHGLNMYFSKQQPDSNTWLMHAQLSTPDRPDSPLTDLAAYSLKFDANGNLTSVSPEADGAGSSSDTKAGFSVDQNELNNGAQPLNFSLDLAGSTQTAQDFAAGNPSQDGYASGALTGINIQDDGMVTGSYANGQSVNLAQIALANFRDEQGLQPVSGNAWTETNESGQPAIGTAGSGQLGNLRGGNLEKSNVDLSQQLVNMIISQRNYQANAQTIKTQDQVLQTAVNLR